MSRFVDVEFSSASDPIAAVADAITAFVRESPQWRHLEAESAEYARSIEGPAVMAEDLSGGGGVGVAVAIASRHGVPDRLRIQNIVPVRGELTPGQYNAAAGRFVAGFRRFCRRRRLHIVARVRRERVPEELREIIPGGRCRALFEQFLFAGNIWRTPTTTHPNDIEKLDEFICAVSRYGGSIHLPALRRWLIDRKQWPAGDAGWTCERIETGLQILRANRQF